MAVHAQKPVFQSEQIQGTWILENPELSDSLIQNWIKPLQGNLTQSSLQEIQFQVPSAAGDSVLQLLRGHGYWILQNKSRQNLTQNLNELESQIGFKEKAIEDFLKILSQSNAQSFSQVEEEINQINEELGQLQMQKLQLLKEAKYTHFSLNLSPRPKIVPQNREPSPFPWVRDLGFASLWNAFYDQPMEIEQ